MSTIVTQKTESWRASMLLNLYILSAGFYAYFFKRNKAKWKRTLKDLSNMPNGTLGKALFNFVTENHFSLKPKLENHDVYHVLLGYSPEVQEEVAMQFFLLGNGKRSLYAVGTAIIGFMVLPEYWDIYVEALHRGMHTKPIWNWQFEHLLLEKTEQLKSFIFCNDKIQHTATPYLYI